MTYIWWHPCITILGVIIMTTLNYSVTYGWIRKYLQKKSYVNDLLQNKWLEGGRWRHMAAGGMIGCALGYWRWMIDVILFMNMFEIFYNKLEIRGWTGKKKKKKKVLQVQTLN